MAYSESSGETSLLNDECAVVLQLLPEGGCPAGYVCEALAVDSDLERDELSALVSSALSKLIETGFVHRVSEATAGLK